MMGWNGIAAEMVPLAAIDQYDNQLIHHSDRGSQYLYRPYLNQLQEKQTQISMGLIGQENAFAERINGTIKKALNLGRVKVHGNESVGP